MNVCIALPGAATLMPNATNDTSTFDQDDITVWVETPLVDNGWIPFDPLPTAAEQELQAQLAEQDPPEQEPDDPEPEDQPVEVTPMDRPNDPSTWPWVATGALVTLLALLLVWVKVVPARTVHRRRRIADPSAAVHAAWATVTDAFTDLDLGLRAALSSNNYVDVLVGGGYDWGRIEQDDVRIYIDADSFPLVAGTRIDFSRQGLNEQFTFENPKSAGACGCGESFTTDAERMA